jgi:hypothetical protein
MSYVSARFRGTLAPARLDSLTETRPSESRLGSTGSRATLPPAAPAVRRPGRSSARSSHGHELAAPRPAAEACGWIAARPSIGTNTHSPGDEPEARSAPPSPKEEAMPNGIYPVPKFRPAPHRKRPTRAPLALRARTWWKRGRLDEALASGADSASTPELALRRKQLQSAPGRSTLANAIVKLLGPTGRPDNRRGAGQTWPRGSLHVHRDQRSGWDEIPPTPARDARLTRKRPATRAPHARRPMTQSGDANPGRRGMVQLGVQTAAPSRTPHRLVAPMWRGYRPAAGPRRTGRGYGSRWTRRTAARRSAVAVAGQRTQKPGQLERDRSTVRATSTREDAPSLTNTLRR